MSVDVDQALEQAAAVAAEPAEERKKMTLVVMSGDMDKLFGAFIIATGAAAMGMDVVMFFTFWGLRALKKADAKHGKSFFGKMLGMHVRGGGIEKANPSKFSFGGMGRWMFGKMMGANNVATLPELRDLAVHARRPHVRLPDVDGRHGDPAGVPSSTASRTRSASASCSPRPRTLEDPVLHLDALRYAPRHDRALPGAARSRRGAPPCPTTSSPISISTSRACSARCRWSRSRQNISNVPVGGVIRAVATDPGSMADIPAWAKSTGNEVLPPRRSAASSSSSSSASSSGGADDGHLLFIASGVGRLPRARGLHRWAWRGASGSGRRTPQLARPARAVPEAGDGRRALRQDAQGHVHRAAVSSRSTPRHVVAAMAFHLAALGGVRRPPAPRRTSSTFLVARARRGGHERPSPRGRAASRASLMLVAVLFWIGAAHLRPVQDALGARGLPAAGAAARHRRSWATTCASLRRACTRRPTARGSSRCWRSSPAFPAELARVNVGMVARPAHALRRRVPDLLPVLQAHARRSARSRPTS